MVSLNPFYKNLKWVVPINYSCARRFWRRWRWDLTDRGRLGGDRSTLNSYNAIFGFTVLYSEYSSIVIFIILIFGISKFNDNIYNYTVCL